MTPTTPQRISCPNCHQLLPASASHCPHCGTKLAVQGAIPVNNAQQVHPGTGPGSASGSSPGNIKSGDIPITANATSNLTRPLSGVVKQLDKTATTNMNIAGVLTSFYVGAIFAGKISSNPLNTLVYALPVCFLLATIILAVRVCHLDGYLTDDYMTLIRKKERRLKWSSLSLEIAIGILIIAVAVYLLRPV